MCPPLPRPLSFSLSLFSPPSPPPPTCTHPMRPPSSPPLLCLLLLHLRSDYSAIDSRADVAGGRYVLMRPIDTHLAAPAGARGVRRCLFVLGQHFVATHYRSKSLRTSVHFFANTHVGTSAPVLGRTLSTIFYFDWRQNATRVCSSAKGVKNVDNKKIPSFFSFLSPIV